MTRIKELMDEFNLKQKDFYDNLGITRNVISNLIQGRSDCSTSNLIALCKLFQVSAEYFLCESNEGVYVSVLGERYSLSKDKFVFYKSVNKIVYVNGIRTLDVNSIDDIELVNGFVPYIKLKNEIL